MPKDVRSSVSVPAVGRELAESDGDDAEDDECEGDELEGCELFLPAAARDECEGEDLDGAADGEGDAGPVEWAEMMEGGEEGGVGADGQERPEEGPGDEGASWAWGCGVASAGDDDGEENDVGGEDECGLDERWECGEVLAGEHGGGGEDHADL